MNSRLSNDNLEVINTEKSFYKSQTKSAEPAASSHGKRTRLSNFSKSIKSSTKSLSSQSTFDSQNSRKSSAKSILPIRVNLLVLKFKAVSHSIGFCRYWAKWGFCNFERNLKQYISFALIMNQNNQYFNPFIDEDTLIKTEMMNFKRTFKELIENNENCIDEESREILRKTRRTLKEVETLKKTFKFMSQMKSINQLTLVMQDKFYHNCRLEEFAQNRVVVVQENRPEFFYIIIKGSLVCTYKRKGDKKSNTICFIEKGGTYGDLPVSRLLNFAQNCSI